jgi:hypothetical protein
MAKRAQNGPPPPACFPQQERVFLRHTGRITTRNHNDYDTIALCGLIREVVDVYQYVAEEMRISVATDLPESCEALVNRNRIRQVFGDLLDNTIKYNKDAGTDTNSARIEKQHSGDPLPRHGHGHPGRRDKQNLDAPLPRRQEPVTTRAGFGPQFGQSYRRSASRQSLRHKSPSQAKSARAQSLLCNFRGPEMCKSSYGLTHA